ncbi:MAG: hypothetical protein CMP81_13140 [Fulvimarina sp.]|nr:hypothetical protein [Fulvimarina sp.]
MALDPYWTQACEAVGKLLADKGPLAVALPGELRSRFAGSVAYGAAADAVLLHKGMMSVVPLDSLAQTAAMTPVFENAVFVLHVRGADAGPVAPAGGGMLRRLFGKARPSALEAYLGDVAAARFSGRQTVFLHIPKTGGTSIFAAAAGKFSRPLQLRSNAELMETRDHLPAHDFISGHIAFDAVETVLTGATYAALVRDPFDRLVSATGHARRPGENVRRLPPDMRVLRTGRLRTYLDTSNGRAELFIQQGIIAGLRGPVPAARLEERLERIAVGTTENMAAFLARNRRLLKIEPGEVGRRNATAERDLLVPQEEIDEALAHHGDMIEEAREFHRAVAARESA